MLKESNQILEQKNNEKQLKNEYVVNENKAIGLYKEKYIKLMLIDDDEKRIQRFDELIEEMTQYTSVVRKERTSKERHWTPSNKYRINHGYTFLV